MMRGNPRGFSHGQALLTYLQTAETTDNQFFLSGCLLWIHLSENNNRNSGQDTTPHQPSQYFICFPFFTLSCLQSVVLLKKRDKVVELMHPVLMYQSVLLL